VGLFDIFKGFFIMYFALRLFPDNRLALLCGFLVVLGHCFPIFIKFKGGKGVATAVGVYAALSPISLLCSLGIFVATVFLTRYVSLGSLVAMFFYPIFVLYFIGEYSVAILGLAIYGLILFRHAGNIKRLLAAKERKLGDKIT
jgi:glycerol-3-phosphate acyltransferase PlsY